MFLAARVVHGRRYLYLMKSTYNKETKKSSNSIVVNYGPFDKVPEYIRKAYDDKQQRRKLAQELESQIRSQDFEKASQVIHELDQPNHFNRSYALRYGHLPLKTIWEKELGLKYKLDYLQKTHTAIEAWRLNDLAFYLCALKVLDPSSYFKAVQIKSEFLYCPWHNIVQDNFYRGLDYIYQFREELLAHAVKSHLKESKKEIKVAFFDCTNTFFETPYDDITWQVIRFTRQRTKELKKMNCSDSFIDEYLSGEQFAEELTEELERNQEEVLRMRGPSKEGRFAQPIVTVALAIDQDGFPIDCKVFAGNLSEIHTVVPMIKSLKMKYGVEDIYFVADRGLNSAEKLETIQSEKLGFVVGQSVANANPTMAKEMFDLEGYKNCEISPTGQFIVREQPQLDAQQFRFKVCTHSKTFRTSNSDWKEDSASNVPKTKKNTVNCKIIYTFSKQRQKKDLLDLDNQIAKANKAISDGLLLGNQFGGGWRSLLQTKKEQCSGKEQKEQFRACGLKEELIEQKRKVAGYSAVVFSHPQNKDISTLSDMEVLETYHKLVGIEDCFKVMKSNFSIRPVYVRLRERITAHCYLCVLSLMMMKIIQTKLSEKGCTLSAEKISEALANAFVVPVPSSDGKISNFLNIGMNVRFHKPCYTGKGRVEQNLNDVEDNESIWKKFEANRNRHGALIDQILDVTNLNPLSLYNSVKEIKERLGILSVPANKFLSPEMEKYQEKLAGYFIR